jgi:hypothetical protein
LYRAFHYARLLDGKSLEELRKIENFVLFKGRKALVDCLGPFDEASNNAHAPLLERGHR